MTRAMPNKWAQRFLLTRGTRGQTLTPLQVSVNDMPPVAVYVFAGAEGDGMRLRSCRKSCCVTPRTKQTKKQA